MKKLILQNQSGFTLIELIVVLAVTAILTTMSLAYYQNFTQQLRLKKDAKSLLSLMELAKKKATVGDLYQACDNFTGYEVSVSTDQADLNFVCNSTPQNVTTFNFSNNIAPINNYGTISFSPMGLNTIALTEITIKNSNINMCVTIDISPIGVLYLDETLVSC